MNKPPMTLRELHARLTKILETNETRFAVDSRLESEPENRNDLPMYLEVEAMPTPTGRARPSTFVPVHAVEGTLYGFPTKGSGRVRGTMLKAYRGSSGW